jgi:hypothetical protein
MPYKPGLGQGHDEKKDTPMLNVEVISCITPKLSVRVRCYKINTIYFLPKATMHLVFNTMHKNEKYDKI